MVNKIVKLSWLVAALCMALPAAAQYKAEKNGDVVRLEDAKSQTVVSIHPYAGNQAYEMKVKGQDAITSIPFLGPWANRLDEMAFYANGKKYPFNMDLGNIRPPQAIHGFYGNTDKWIVEEVKADANAAWVTSKLEVWRQPDWMAQFPFAHTVEITHRLQNGVLEVIAKVQNLSAEPMPISIGFHPYFKVAESTRDQWTLNVPARAHYILDKDKIPTGETEAIEKFFPNPRAVPVKDFNLDDVFGDLIRDGSGRAVAVVQGKTQRVEVMLGPKYKSLVVFTPGNNAAGRGADPNPAQTAPAAGRGGNANQQAAGGRGGNPANNTAVAFEPMVAPTDALNLAHKGLYKELQSIAPGETWQESFWVRPVGF
jgi:aldose 1-epimerase